MTKDQLHNLKDWFENYTDTFLNDADADCNYLLKIHHTHRVCDAARLIGKALHLSAEDLNLAEAVGLFHDVGRFRQFRTYGTFADYKSADHAALGVDVLDETQVLVHLPQAEIEIIRKAVSAHNKFMLPEDEPDRILLLCKIVRDADKLDIYKVVSDDYQSRDSRINKSIFWELPDIDEISDGVVQDIQNRQMVRKEHVKTHVDFKMMQMAWVYGIYFQVTCRELKKLNYLELIFHSLPDLPVIASLYRQITMDLNARCEAAS